MKVRPRIAALGIAIAFLYASAVAIGFWVKDLSSYKDQTQAGFLAPWQPPSLASVPDDAHGASIRLGSAIFNETPLYAPKSTGAKLSCTSCHAEGGIQPFASPMVGLPKLFPMYNARAGHVISLEDRIQECFVRSENGRPLDYKGTEMRALVDYIMWLSTPEPGHFAFQGRGLISLPSLKPNVRHGAEVYAYHCAGCHGQHGEGEPYVLPPLWGSDSFNDGAGMYGVAKMAAFIQQNMPQNSKGILSPQDAFDVAGFIHSQPRPAFNVEYAGY